MPLASPFDQRVIWIGGIVFATAVTVLIVLPVLPAAGIAWTYKINPTLGETVGWPQFVRTVDGVWKSLPPGQRAGAVIFTADYGEAGAINELGRGTGLPTAVLHPRAGSGHAVESVRRPQPGMGRSCLRVHRSPAPVGPAMAPVAPLRLTPDPYQLPTPDNGREWCGCGIESAGPVRR